MDFTAALAFIFAFTVPDECYIHIGKGSDIGVIGTTIRDV